MEISLNTGRGQELCEAQRAGHQVSGGRRELRYLEDALQPEENFYITLGLPRNASPEEIRQRWKNLMLLYHPDKQTGDEEWGVGTGKESERGIHRPEGRGQTFGV